MPIVKVSAAAACAEHVVAHPELRVSVAQAEFRRNRPGPWLDYIHRAFDVLPVTVWALIDAGCPRSAEYWLVAAERFAGVITAEQLAQTVHRLGRFHLHDVDESGQVVDPYEREV